MINVVDSVIISLLFFLFAFTHTILASSKLKLKLVEKIGDKIAFYRLFYNIISLIFFGLAWSLSPRPDVIIYDLQYPYDITIFVLQIFSLLGFLWAAKYTDLKEFIGIEQVVRYAKGTYNIRDLDESTELRFDGPMAYCRHPVYLFSILFLALRPSMDLFYLVFFISMTAYFIIGSYYEEKKLVEKYGDKYRQYQKSVARLIPKIY
jgi:protein-S-isoprenylcysteine O-methyltransferase Ste14